MKKQPFVTKEKLDEIIKEYPTPFHLYDEKGIRANAQAVKEAFSWNPGFRGKGNTKSVYLKHFKRVRMRM